MSVKSTSLNIQCSQVIQRMSGIEISEEVTESQLEAACGGPVLLAEAGFFTPIRCYTVCSIYNVCTSEM